MADFVFTGLNSSASSGISTISYNFTENYPIYTVETSNGTVSPGNINFTLLQQQNPDTDLLKKAKPGYLTGRRPSIGLLFPRGYYNR
jgi:hypothetical protein